MFQNKESKKAQRGISEIPVGNVHVHSPVLVSEEAEFTKIIGGKIDTDFYSLSSTVYYKPSTPLIKSVVKDSGMPTSSQLFTIAKKRNCTNKSKASTTTPTDKTNEPVPRLTDLLQKLNEGEASSTSTVVQKDSQGSYIKMVVFLCWERIPVLQFRRPVLMWSTLMLALETPYVISTKRLKVGNNIHCQIPRMKLVWYAQLCLQDFSFNGVSLKDNQISCALKLLEMVFAVWSNPWSAVGPMPLWYGSDIHEYQLQQAMGSRQPMILVGNLVLSGSKVVYHQRLHHMPEYIEWLLGGMYSVGGKRPKEYAQQESLLWGCILLGLGLAFPYSIGVNRVNFLPIDDSPFLLFTFCWLPNVWIIYVAIATVLIQLCLGL
ncbi:hypothetical protein DSO57_1007055 [Entomophthora muscae]|uniref:Uncharacterized protein n=1 Tax=Entomophthora muscae TaxID=34485 RepID=A0ACC2S9A6_9FUNG|nr:hypothetical protein DSO57_1007055 [Entomophthora muscae]